ncbi:hypothetical protein [Alienimonas californiensis]|uniref:Uncharacterized protein n=1 Tax=Alienimonas californiensis TaxID=2527989 RepID=A0A517P8L6_9PLAN|nr:hypothetical protein [Alienimonas californiensis]QDT15718.1 hypothetical protein CA12_18090 [Alienimonas californiensis]
MSRPPLLCFVALAALWAGPAAPAADQSTPDDAAAPDYDAIDRPAFGGIYPHLAYFNNEGECGTGAVVPWAGRLWAVTYAPHSPRGSSDKLYEITPDLEQIVRPESIGGTPANRMIHRESDQLFIGPYAIRGDGEVRVIPYTEMFGRPTANARHLFDPAGRIYYASMEEALYEIDVDTLAVAPLFRDEADKTPGPRMDLPGYHGKGLYSGQGRVIYANNGEHGRAAQTVPTTPSGALATWDGKASGEDAWTLVRRNQFTEVTGPGGIYGNENPATDPVWSMGWDAKSLILMVLHGGEWTNYRLPKASHSYDGAHGWNTEWPRIREIGTGDDLLMTMHGSFWTFPKGFEPGSTAGIRPRSNYLKVIGDFCRWGDRVVMGCDDTAHNEFLNQRKAKGEIAAPQSQSNLWFVEPDSLDAFGPALGRGAVWKDEKVAADTPSDPYLFAGYDRRGVHLSTDVPTTFTFEIDRHGTGEWAAFDKVRVAGAAWHAFPADADGEWVRLRLSEPATVTAQFQYADRDDRPTADELPASDAALFAGLAEPGDEAVIAGVMRARGGNERTLHIAADNGDGKPGHYVLDAEMNLTLEDDAKALDYLTKNAAIPDRAGILTVDAASVLYVDDDGARYRLPKDDRFAQPGPAAFGGTGFGRLAREVATERDLFNCHGTFYELPASNAGGFARVRPVATHGRRIHDYCSYRGLLVLSGIDLSDAGDNPRVIRSADGKAAVWVGAIDEAWKLGKPVGRGGPWQDTKVTAGAPSDPYLMTGYDRKSLTLSADRPTEITVEVDVAGDGTWMPYKTFRITPDAPVQHTFPEAFSAYWVRTTADADATATAQLSYD